MKRIALQRLLVVGLIILLASVLQIAHAQNGVGIDVANPLEMLDVDGAIKIGTDFNNTTGAPSGGAGTIRWNGTNFEGWDGTQWVQFGGGSGSDTDWTINGNDQYSAVSGNVGIGTTTPDAKMQVVGSAIIGADGQTITGSNLLIVGENNTASNDRVIVSGSNNSASGGNSITFGRDNVNSSGANGLIGGAENTVSSQMAAALGFQNTSSGYASFTTNRSNTASGNHTAVFGQNNTAFSLNEMVVGMNATEYTPNSTGSYNANDRIFVVGDGPSAASRSNALTIYKDGTVNINDAYDLPAADGTSGYVMTTDGSGAVSWVDPTGISGSVDEIVDADADTKVEVEASADEDKIRFQTAGTHRMTIDEDGHVGIGGNLDPRHPLDMNNSLNPMLSSSTVDVSELSMRVRNGSTTNGHGTGIGFATGGVNLMGAAIVHERQGTNSLGSLHFATKSDQGVGTDLPIRMTIRHNGNVGIGTQSPNEELEVQGAIRMVDGNQQAGYIPVSDANGTMVWTDPTTVTTADDEDWTFNGNDIHNANSGNVGIGINTPSTALHVLPATTNGSAATFETGGTTYPSAAVKITASSHATSERASIQLDNWHFVQDRTGTGTEDFSLWQESTSEHRFVINTSGNVGIGDETPDAKLDVEGSIQMVDGNQASGYIPVSDANGTMTWTDPSTIVTASEDEIVDADGDTRIQVEESSDEDKIRFDAEGLEVMVIEKSGTEGLVGIGTNDPRSELHISDGSASAKTVNDQWGYGASLTITDNSIPRIYFEAQGQATDKKLMDISYIGQKLSIGSLNDSGNSWDNQYILSAHRDGNVGVGVSGTPSEKLEVNGSIRATNPGTSPSGSNIILGSPANDVGVTMNRGNGSGGSQQRWDIKIDNDNSLKLRSQNSNDYVALDNTGNLGIGDMTPDAKLDVEGSIQMVDGNQAAGFIPVSDANGTMVWTDPTTITTADDGDWTISGTDQYSAVSGNVGIGTTTPESKLNVFVDNNGLNTPLTIRNGDDTEGGNAVGIAFANNNGLGEPKGMIVHERTTGFGRGSFHILNSDDITAAGATLADARMTITRTGLVGIAETDPEEQLHVNGSIRMVDGSQAAGYIPVSDANGTMTWTDPTTVTTADDGDWTMSGADMYSNNTGFIGMGTSSPQHELHIHDANNDNAWLQLSQASTGSGQQDGFVLGVNSSEQAYIMNKEATDMVFRTDNTDRMRILASGNVAIGAATANAKLDVAGDIHVNENGILFTDPENSNTTVELRSSDPTYGDEGVTLRTLTNPTSGEPIFRVLSSGGAERLRVEHGGYTRVDNGFTTTGNVGVDATTPAYDITFGGNENRIIQVEETTGGDGHDLTIQAGAAQSGTANNDGGQLILSSGAATGNGGSNPRSEIVFKTATQLGSSSSATQNPTEKMRIDANGNVGIGTSTPGYLLDVQDSKIGAGAYIARIENTADVNSDQCDGLLIVAGHSTYNSSHQSAFVYFESPDGNYCGRVKQNGNSSVNYIDGSDLRLKENIRPTKYGLKDLMKIEVSDYNYKKDSPDVVQTGYIAQQLYTAYPDAVDVGGDDPQKNPWGVDYGQVTPLLVKAMQEQQAMIESLQSENAALKAENASTASRLQLIEEQLGIGLKAQR